MLVKFISESDPYDPLLQIAEHEYRCKEIESIALATAETKKRRASLPRTEQNYEVRKLDAE